MAKVDKFNLCFIFIPSPYGFFEISVRIPVFNFHVFIKAYPAFSFTATSTSTTAMGSGTTTRSARQSWTSPPIWTCWSPYSHDSGRGDYRDKTALDIQDTKYIQMDGCSRNLLSNLYVQVYITSFSRLRYFSVFSNTTGYRLSQSKTNRIKVQYWKSVFRSSRYAVWI